MSLRIWSKGGREGISHFAESWPLDAPGFALCDRKLLLKCLEDSVRGQAAASEPNIGTKTRESASSRHRSLSTQNQGGKGVVRSENLTVMGRIWTVRHTK